MLAARRPFVIGEVGSTMSRARPPRHRSRVSRSSAFPRGASTTPKRREAARENEAARDAAPDTMIFRETPANRFVDSAEDRLSTFALDVDTGSYTLTRGYLDRGLLPPPAAIRVEEFVNAQELRRSGAPAWRLRARRRRSPAAFYPGERTRLLRFAVKAREIDDARPEARRPHLRRRRLGLDEPGEPPRSGEARPRSAARRARPGRSRRPRGLRQQRPDPAAPHAGSRGDPQRDRASSAPRARPTSKRGCAWLTTSPTRAGGRGRATASCSAPTASPTSAPRDRSRSFRASARRRSAASPSPRSASAWATTTTP